MIVTSKELLKLAKAEKFAVPAPDYIDLDMARIFCLTAEEEGKPIILSFAQSFDSTLSLEEAALVGRYWAEKVSVPIVLHLDHGTDFDYIKRAIDLGFSSVMIDASMKSFDENVAITQKVVEYAHNKGVSVEAEIGHVGSGENYESHEKTDSIYTETAEAVRFVELTNVDSLAVSIGTAHGIYKGGVPKLNFERLKEISEAVSVPLVLHGGSGTGDDGLRKCSMNGIGKVNIFTDFLVAATNAINNTEITDYFEIKELSNEAMADVLRHYFKVFNTQGGE